MKINKIIRILTLIIVSILFTACFVLAEIYPSNPTAIFDLSTNTVTYGSNMTSSYPNSSAINGTRGYIYNITINESQPTQSWIGYIGNINGNYALLDASGNKLYDWTIANVTGEVYATKEGPQIQGNIFEGNSGAGTVNPFNGGIPIWDSLICANSTQINTETERFNHSVTSEDRLNNTFKNAGYSIVEFYAGPTLINNTVSGGSTGCYGTYLRNNTINTTDWKETVLTDQTYQNKSDAEDTIHIFDIIYAVQINNDTEGFDGNLYDFQILLPQSGLSGTQDNIAYYFYIELI